MPSFKGLRSISGPILRDQICERTSHDEIGENDAQFQSQLTRGSSRQRFFEVSSMRMIRTVYKITPVKTGLQNWYRLADPFGLSSASISDSSPQNVRRGSRLVEYGWSALKQVLTLAL